MSKEKQCECCHEWWHDSDVKENLCPNCYDYFKQLKRQLEEKEKQIDIISRDNNSYKYNIDEQKRIIDDFAKQLKEKDNYHLRYKLAGADETITNLRQQLAEKQNTIDEINKEFVQSIHDWKALCAEKDKEIEKLKQQYTILENENGKLTTELIMGKYKKAQKEVSFGIQLAIQELEKVKVNLKDRISMMKNEEHSYLQKVVAWYNICDQINNQIKELRGE